MANENSFKLKSKKGNSYQDLFPATSPALIEGSENWVFPYMLRQLSVPPFQGETQIITGEDIYNPQKLMMKSSFEAYLKSGDQSDYDTISQIEVRPNEDNTKVEFVITRLFSYPQNLVVLNLVFFFKEGDVDGK